MIVFFALNNIADIDRNSLAVENGEYFVSIENVKYKLVDPNESANFSSKACYNKLIDELNNNNCCVDFRKECGIYCCGYSENSSGKMLVYNGSLITKFDGEVPILKQQEVMNKIFNFVKEYNRFDVDFAKKIIAESNDSFR